jgi:predicted Abi (CAAX) family protease
MAELNPWRVAPGRLMSRLIKSLGAWPDAADWGSSLMVGAATLAVLGVIGFSTGLYELHPANLSGFPWRPALVFLAPALGEEAVFRGILVPGRDEVAKPLGPITLATLIFMVWHLAEAWLFLPLAAPLFDRPDFLACAGVLGFGCGWIRWRAGSLWPAVFLHWLMVNIWQTWLGGFIL